MDDAGSLNASSDFRCNSSIANCSSPGRPPTSGLLPSHIAAGVVMAASCLLGVPANVAVIVRLGRRPRRSSISGRLFFSLAASDLLCLLCLPAGVLAFLEGPLLTNGACRRFIYFFFFSITSSSNILVLISIQRYCQVLHPLRWSGVGRARRRLILYAVWLLGVLGVLPAALSFTEVKTEHGRTGGHSCKNRRITPALEVAYMGFLFFSRVGSLSIFMLLVRGVRQAQMPDRKRPRITELFIRVIAVSLIAGFAPFIIRLLHVSALLAESDRLYRVGERLTFLECFYFFNHCLNPFLYFFTSGRYRRESSTKGRSPPVDNSSNHTCIVFARQR